MRINIIPIRKCIAITLLLLWYSYSFSQYTPAGGNKSNYYPRMHDSATTVMPELIKQNFIYYGFLSSLNNHISFEYDRQLTDEIMLSGQVGIINSGFSQSQSNNNNYSNTNTEAGGYFEGGIKLFFNPDYTRDGRHGYYTVEGLYLKPQLIVSIFNTTSTSYYSPYAYPPQTTSQYSYTGAVLMINIGGQWIIAHALAIDLYAGVGVGIGGNSSSNAPSNDDYYSYLMTSGNDFPLAFAGGINIGLPF